MPIKKKTHERHSVTLDMQLPKGIDEKLLAGYIITAVDKFGGFLVEGHAMREGLHISSVKIAKNTYPNPKKWVPVYA